MSGILKLTVLFVAFVFLALGCNGPEPGPPTSQKIAPAPEEHQKAQLIAKINRRFESPQAHYQLGRLYQSNGLWDKAEYEYNLVLSFDPVHRRAQAATVALLHQKGLPQKARDHADIYIKQVSGSAESSFNLGKAFQAERLYRYTLACYEQALQRAPDSAAIHKQLGYYYLTSGDQSRARYYLRRSFELDPYQPEVAGQLGRLGVAVRMAQKTDKDAKKLDKAITDTEEAR